MGDVYSIDMFAPRVPVGSLLRRVNELGIPRVEAAFLTARRSPD